MSLQQQSSTVTSSLEGPRLRASRSALLVLSLVSLSCSGSPSGPSTTRLAVTSISPNTGSTFGGTTITITGSNFSAGASVSIGGVPATAIAVVGSSSITATTGEHAVGAVGVSVSSGGSTATLNNAFTYVTPGLVVNTPPSVSGISARGTRLNEPAQFADANEEITVTAIVQDAETPLDKLVYEWTSNVGGTFSGSGPLTKWRAPTSVPVPTLGTLTLTIIERYQNPGPTGLPVTEENRVTASIQVSLHDSIKEVGDMARQFLLDFSDSGIKDIPYILRNFTNSCDEARQEASEIQANREAWTITSFTIGSPAVTVNFGGTCPFRARRGDACAQVLSSWKSNGLKGQRPDSVTGTDQVTALYRPTEGGWKLCGSDFDGIETFRSLSHPFIY